MRANYGRSAPAPIRRGRIFKLRQQAAITLRHPAFWVTAAAFSAIFALTGHTADSDNAAGGSLGVSAYTIYAKIISALNLEWAIVVANGVAISTIVTNHWRKRNWACVVFFANPFLWINLVDVYNRAILSLLLVHAIDFALYRQRRLIALAGLTTFATLHPFNFVAVIAGAAPLLSPALILATSSLELITSISIIERLFPDKVALYRSLGDTIAIKYAGNFQIHPQHYNIGLSPVWIIAVAVPGIGLLYPLDAGIVLAIYMIAWYAIVFLLARGRLPVILFSLAVMVVISTIVGNSAVAARHFLPILYFALIVFGHQTVNRLIAYGLLRRSSTRQRTPRQFRQAISSTSWAPRSRF